jgi:hypothetical protein
MACLSAKTLLMIEEVRTIEIVPVISGDRWMALVVARYSCDCLPSANSF